MVTVKVFWQIGDIILVLFPYWNIKAANPADIREQLIIDRTHYAPSISLSQFLQQYEYNLFVVDSKLPFSFPSYLKAWSLCSEIPLF
ncbi:hypothetical protein CC2G_009854 [Coprinopsis cinerea AmutBmut pab1-1]|nr:hypothetical protein CC2G_009854 [Coprinopsis cinerea AmutBmut pab1-1]